MINKLEKQIFLKLEGYKSLPIITIYLPCIESFTEIRNIYKLVIYYTNYLYYS